jgi:hypothetical protein
MVWATGRAHTDWEIKKEKMWPFKGTRMEGELKVKSDKGKESGGDKRWSGQFAEPIQTGR